MLLRVNLGTHLPDNINQFTNYHPLFSYHQPRHYTISSSFASSENIVVTDSIHSPSLRQRNSIPTGKAEPFQGLPSLVSVEEHLSNESPCLWAKHLTFNLSVHKHFTFSIQSPRKEKLSPKDMGEILVKAVYCNRYLTLDSKKIRSASNDSGNALCGG